jgi:xeroderma pigmentosum group C-complementing protein
MPRNTEAFAGLPDFRERAKKREGSPDYGAQLFCAWLRSLGVDARLVCSIQPLPFAFAASLREMDDSIDAIEFLDGDADPAALPAEPVKSGECQPIVRIGHSRKRGESGRRLERPAPVVPTARPIPRPRHPIFWIEAFDPYLQRWIPVDCMSTQTVGRPTVFEPAMNDSENSMAYVFAFEESGFAKDVTRRYAKAFIAKTRKSRVERSDRGAKWLKKALKPFKRVRPLVGNPRLSTVMLIAAGPRSSGRCCIIAARNVRRIAKEYRRLQGPPCVRAPKAHTAK